MSKRKREDGFDAPEIEDQTLRLKVSRLKAKHHQGVKVLHNALKLARGFERQKLGRRQKNASSNPQMLLRLREEVIVLKQLQLEQTARSRLLKILARTKRIKEHPAYTAAFGSQAGSEQAKSGAEVTVVGRLFNSNPVKKALADILKTIYGVLGIPQLDTMDTKNEVDPTRQESKKPAKGKSEDEFDGFSGDESTSHDARQGTELSGSEIDDDELFENARARLASSDDDSSDEDFAIELPMPETAGIRANDSGKEHTSISPSPSNASGPLDRRRLNTDLQRTIPGKTAFFPSLSMGGYYSGSESEDDINQYQGPALPKERKNRRGQRARQQLAELKYGQSAKHLGSRKVQDERGSGWDAKRGAIGQGDRQNYRARQGKVDPKFTKDRALERTPRTSKSETQKSRDDDGPIHPSWEAAKRRKMQDQTKPSFQGKKITFN